MQADGLLWPDGYSQKEKEIKPFVGNFDLRKVSHLNNLETINYHTHLLQFGFHF